MSCTRQQKRKKTAPNQWFSNACIETNYCSTEKGGIKSISQISEAAFQNEKADNIIVDVAESRIYYSNFGSPHFVLRTFFIFPFFSIDIFGLVVEANQKCHFRIDSILWPSWYIYQAYSSSICTLLNIWTFTVCHSVAHA